MLRNIQESEVILTNDQFITDGSCAIRSLDNALKHDDKLLNKFVRQEYVLPEINSDTHGIAECQAVGDNASKSQRIRARTATFERGSGLIIQNEVISQIFRLNRYKCQFNKCVEVESIDLYS